MIILIMWWWWRTVKFLFLFLKYKKKTCYLHGNPLKLMLRRFLNIIRKRDHPKGQSNKKNGGLSILQPPLCWDVCLLLVFSADGHTHTNFRVVQFAYFKTFPSDDGRVEKKTSDGTYINRHRWTWGSCCRWKKTQGVYVTLDHMTTSNFNVNEYRDVFYYG